MADLPTSQSEICLALKHNNIHKVQNWIRNGWKMNKRVTFRGDDHKGYLTPLCIAVRLLHTEVAQSLLSAGADPSVGGWLEERGFRAWLCPLAEAVRTDQVQLARQLIQAGADVNQRARGVIAEEEEGGTIIYGDMGQSYLHLAAQHWQLAMLRVLLENGACVSALNGHGETPLHMACDYFHDGCIFALLQWGAPVSLPQTAVSSPLEILSKSDGSALTLKKKRRSIQLLFDAGCEITYDSWWKDIVDQGYGTANVGIFNDEEFRQWCQTILTSPRSLKQLCRIAVRQLLQNVNRCNPRDVARLTCLPRSLQSYLCMSE